MNGMNDLINNFDFCKWREKYVWKYPSQQASENKIEELENMVRENILQRGRLNYRTVLLEIRRWKTGKRWESTFLKNSDNSIESNISAVLKLINADTINPSECIKEACRLDGVQIPVASAFLRFLDTDKHRFGIIDKYVARFCNNLQITDFKLRENDDYIESCNKNKEEYSTFYCFLHQIVENLRNRGVYFDAVDVEMAIFAYCKDKEYAS